MRQNIKEYIAQNAELQQFIREQPQWYRELSRNPNQLEVFEIASLHYYKNHPRSRGKVFKWCTNGVYDG
ncbi:YlbE-like family protein [Niallia circulans]